MLDAKEDKIFTPSQGRVLCPLIILETSSESTENKEFAPSVFELQWLKQAGLFGLQLGQGRTHNIFGATTKIVHPIICAASPEAQALFFMGHPSRQGFHTQLQKLFYPVPNCVVIYFCSPSRLVAYQGRP